MLRGQLNSQILRYLHFSNLNPEKVVRAVNRQPVFTARGTRRAFLSSKSNTGAGEIVIKKASQNFQELGQKIEDISKSVNSIDTGAIFLPRLGHELSRNGLVVSVYAF